MSYADQTAVATWTQNLNGTAPGGLFTQASAMCDAQIDADLSAYFHWPYDPNDVAINNPPPALIQQMANVLTAALIEDIAYSQMQSKVDTAMDSGGSTTYGRFLYNMYSKNLKRLISGAAIINDLIRYNSLGSKNARKRFHLETGLAYDSTQEQTGPDRFGYDNDIEQNRIENCS